MKYPIKVSEVSEVPVRVTTFVPGKWYKCFKSNSSAFTVGFAYLCAREAYASGNYHLVDNTGSTYAIEDITSSFAEVTER